MLEVFFAGLWPIVGRLGFGVVVIALALGWFMQPWFPVFKKTALWVAATTFVVMLAYSTGVIDANNRNRAREDAVVKREESAAARERAAVDDSIVVQPRGVREHCKKVAYDRC